MFKFCMLHAKPTPHEEGIVFTKCLAYDSQWERMEVVTSSELHVYIKWNRSISTIMVIYDIILLESHNFLNKDLINKYIFLLICVRSLSLKTFGKLRFLT